MVAKLTKAGAYTVSNDSFTFNATASGQAQVNQGQTVNATQVNNVGGELTAAMFFESIEAETKKLPEVERSVVHDGAVEPLKQIATAGQQTESVTASVQGSTFQKYLDILRPHASLIVKCVAAFSEASLTALASSNPVVAGVLAVAKEVRSATK